MPKRVDSNQKQIVQALRKAGVSVLHLHAVGHGCPDILVGARNNNYLFEIKQEGGKLTPDEERFYVSWLGQVHVIHCAEDALKIIGIIK